jgi:hypothetical protein
MCDERVKIDQLPNFFMRSNISELDGVLPQGSGLGSRDATRHNIA